MSTDAHKRLLGILAAITLCVVALTTLALTAGVPCNGSVLAKAQGAMERMRVRSDYVSPPGVVENPYGITCYDHFGGPSAAELLVHALALILIGALGAGIGPGINPMRGAIGTFLGLQIFDWVIAADWEVAGTGVVVVSLVYSIIGGVLGFAGGWMIRVGAKRIRARS